MNPNSACVDSDSLRAQLMAPDPMQRVIALHSLELELGQKTTVPDARLAGEVQKFAARGIPFYAPHGEHYRAWVHRVVDYWERLHAVASPSGSAS
jgi:hypothetical protein